MRAHLTEAREGWKAAEGATVPGMAFFAKTGPELATCRSCIHWGLPEKNSFHRDEDGYLKPKRCRKAAQFRRWANEPPPRAGVPAETPACKYYEPRRKPPAYHSTRRRVKDK